MGIREAISRLAKAFRPEPGVVLPSETSLISYPEFIPAGFAHGVEVLNDNTTPMQFVVDALGTHANLRETEAIKAMLEIHSKGGKLFPAETPEHAQSIAAALAAAAQERGYPLICRAVSRGSPPNISLEWTREG
jgi:ATP-dependent Clp protease adapter protein ClpS